MILKPPRGAQLRKGHPLSRDLVGYWLMNEGAGSVVRDLSGNGRHGTVAGSSWVPGPNGQSLFTPDAAGAVSLGDFSSEWPAISVVCRCKFPSVVATTTRLVAKERPDFGCWTLSVNTFEQPGFTVRNTAATSAAAVSATGVTDGGWHTIVGTYDGALVRIYIDAVEADPTPAALTGLLRSRVDYVAIHGSAVGSTITPSASDVTYDHVMIYNRALSPSEIASLYRDPYQMVRRDRVELWSAAASGGGTPATFKPHWVPRRRQVIGGGIL